MLAQLGRELPANDRVANIFVDESLDADELHMATDHSPYEGMTATGWPSLVTVRGRIVAREGRYVGEPGYGRFVERAPIERD